MTLDIVQAKRDLATAKKAIDVVSNNIGYRLKVDAPSVEEREDYESIFRLLKTINNTITTVESELKPFDSGAESLYTPMPQPKKPLLRREEFPHMPLSKPEPQERIDPQEILNFNNDSNKLKDLPEDLSFKIEKISSVGRRLLGVNSMELSNTYVKTVKDKCAQCWAYLNGENEEANARAGVQYEEDVAWDAMKRQAERDVISTMGQEKLRERSELEDAEDKEYAEIEAQHNDLFAVLNLENNSIRGLYDSIKGPASRGWLYNGSTDPGAERLKRIEEMDLMLKTINDSGATLPEKLAMANQNLGVMMEKIKYDANKKWVGHAGEKSVFYKTCQALQEKIPASFKEVKKTVSTGSNPEANNSKPEDESSNTPPSPRLGS